MKINYCKEIVDVPLQFMCNAILILHTVCLTSHYFQSHSLSKQRRVQTF